MPAEPGLFRPSTLLPDRKGPLASERGVALVWAMLGVVTLALLATAALLMSRGEKLVNENFESGQRALYVADQALSQYYGAFRPRDNLDLPLLSFTSIDDVVDSSDVLVDDVFGDYTGADLRVTDLQFQDAWVRITPTKVVESRNGDVYLLEAESDVSDSRPNRPEAIRQLRTYATLVAPVALQAALTAPNGLDGEKSGNRITLDGSKKGKCGSGLTIPSLAVPANYPVSGSSYGHAGKSTDPAKFENKNMEKTDQWSKAIKPDSAGIGIDSSTASYQELKDSLHVDWGLLTGDSTYSGTGMFVVPRDYPTLQAIPFGPMSTSAVWPDILVHGDVTITADLHGFGTLVIDGWLRINHGVLTWRGLIMTGKGIVVWDNPAKSHLHANGAVVTGMNCTSTEISSGTCKNDLKGEHLGVNYAQCDVEAAWAGLLSLRPLTPSRHTRFFQP
jgi:hypothetical protein